MPQHFTQSQYVEALDASDIGSRYSLDVTVSAKRRKSIGFAMGPGGTIQLTIPATMPPADAVSLLTDNRHRLASLVVRAKRYAKEDVVKDLVNGEGFPWLGQWSRLRLIDTGHAAELHRTDTGLWLAIPRAAAERGDARPLINWYCRMGTEWLTQEAPGWWSRMAPDKPLPEVYADSMGTKRWGCYQSGKHRVRIAWQTFQLPPWMVRHILVHELAHATRPRGKPHGPAFWTAFRRAMPCARQDQRAMNASTEARSVWQGDVRTREEA